MKRFKGIFEGIVLPCLIIFGLCSFLPIIAGIIVGLIVKSIQIGIITYLIGLAMMILYFCIMYKVRRAEWKAKIEERERKTRNERKRFKELEKENS